MRGRKGDGSWERSITFLARGSRTTIGGKPASIPLTVHNPHPFAAEAWPITGGVPIPQGRLSDGRNVRLVAARQRGARPGSDDGTLARREREMAPADLHGRCAGGIESRVSIGVRQVRRSEHRFAQPLEVDGSRTAACGSIRARCSSSSTPAGTSSIRASIKRWRRIRMAPSIRRPEPRPRSPWKKTGRFEP